MSRPVYILGAGFSHNFNCEMFPLVSDFLATAKARLIYQPDNRHRDLAFVIRKYFGDDIYPNIEKVRRMIGDVCVGDPHRAGYT